MSSTHQLAQGFHVHVLNAGGHLMNGPIYVCGAEPGDVLEVLPIAPFTPLSCV